MSIGTVNEEVEKRLHEQIKHIGTLPKDSEDYDKAITNLVELNKPYVEQIKVQNAAAQQERENEMAKERMEREDALAKERLKFEMEKAEADRLEAYRARRSKERADEAVLKQNHDEFMIKTIGDSALHVADQVFLGGFLTKGFEFEETGSYGSFTFKEVIKRLPIPGKKK